LRSGARCGGGFFRRAPPSVMLRTPGEIRAGGGSYSEKERAHENFAVSQKDAELLQQLRESLKLKEGEEIPTRIVHEVVHKEADRKKRTAQRWKIPKEEHDV